MAKIAQLIEGNYNILDNIPVINQDLSASGFTPVANTYYRHTGATTDTFTQGVIYLYDTAYHKLGESGGTTLNRYEVTFNNITNNSSLATHLNSIVKNAKGRVQITDPSRWEYSVIWYSDYWMKINVKQQYSNSITFETMDIRSSTGELSNNFSLDIRNGGVTNGTVTALPDTLYVTYFNDTEIL